MSESLSFFVPCLVPKATAQGKGVCVIGGRPRFFKKARQKSAEGTLWSILLPYVPARPFEGPLTLVVTFGFPWRKSEKKSVMKACGHFPIQTKPDLDNLNKSLCDVMTSLRFWHDDSQLSSLCLHKAYTDTPGLTINLTSSLVTQRDGRIVSAL